MSHSPLEAEESEDEYLRFWEAMWSLLREGRSFSGYERNCCFVNVAGGRFADASGISGLDFDDDARAFAAVDWDFDGDIDLWQAARTSPRLRFLRNEHDGDHEFLALRLAGGGPVNRDAIGARVEVYPAGSSAAALVKTVRAGDGFLTQSSHWLHFGLGEATDAERVVVRWPDGRVDAFSDLPAGGFYEIEYGAESPRHFEPQAGRAPLATSPPPEGKKSAALRVAMTGATPLPELSYRDFDGSYVPLEFPRRRPLLINLWASWCGPCLAELRELAERKDELDAAGLDVLVLTVDGVQNLHSAELAASREFLAGIEFTYPSAMVSLDLLKKVRLLQTPFLEESLLESLPTSLLVSADGRLQAIYKGGVDADTLLRDAAGVNAGKELAIPFAGRWHKRPIKPPHDQLIVLAVGMLRNGFPSDAKAFCRAALTFDPSSELAVANRDQIETILQTQSQRLRRAREQALAAPRDADSQFELAEALLEQHRRGDAIDALRQTVTLDPNHLPARLRLGTLLAQEGRLDEARTHLRAAWQLDPGNQEAAANLALIDEARNGSRSGGEK